MSGTFAVTFSVIFAYVADVTEEHERSTAYGLVTTNQNAAQAADITAALDQKPHYHYYYYYNHPLISNVSGSQDEVNRTSWTDRIVFRTSW